MPKDKFLAFLRKMAKRVSYLNVVEMRFNKNNEKRKFFVANENFSLLLFLIELKLPLTYSLSVLV
jgi:hypothetical protein